MDKGTTLFVGSKCVYLRKVAYDNSQRTRRAQLSVEETSHESLVCKRGQTNKVFDYTCHRSRL